MLTKITIRNFKLFHDTTIELGDRVVLVGPNNSGKTSVLQALALWDVGVKKWVAKRGTASAPKIRSGVTINRKDLIAVPVPSANLLWRGLHVREGRRENGKTLTQNILVEIVIEGVSGGRMWTVGLEFDYANEESFYCRALLQPDGARMEVPEEVAALRVAYLPPMSGLAASEPRIEEGQVKVRIGEGRTAEVLRNLCYQVHTDPDESKWQRLARNMQGLFGIDLDPPRHIKERGEIEMTFVTREKVRLDLSSSGRGQQQTLLLLAHMAANPGALLLLDEPDAHLEILRQRQIYQILTETAAENGSQIIAASHSEVILNEAADRDTVIAFIGKPHRIDDRGSQLLKSLKEIGFENYYQAEETGWVLYLEGATDLEVLRAFAVRLGHAATGYLGRPFVRYIGNQPRKAQDHFYGLREAKSDLVGVALYDRLDQALPVDPNLRQMTWKRREVENYLCQRETLLAFAGGRESERLGPIFEKIGRSTMEEAITTIEESLRNLGRPSPWSEDIKASDDFLDPLFKRFYERLKLPNLMQKTDYHTLVPYVPRESLNSEIVEKLDVIVEIARAARPRQD